jgi:hypothetical protein
MFKFILFAAAAVDLARQVATAEPPGKAQTHVKS